jgi:hypothetical protein
LWLSSLENVQCIKSRRYASAGRSLTFNSITAESVFLEEGSDSVVYHSDTIEIFQGNHSCVVDSNSTQLYPDGADFLPILLSSNFNFSSQIILNRVNASSITSETTSSINASFLSQKALSLNSPRNHFALIISGFLDFSPDFDVYSIRELTIMEDLAFGNCRLLEVTRLIVGGENPYPVSVNSSLEIVTDSLMLETNIIFLSLDGGLTTNSLELSDGTRAAIKKLNSSMNSTEINISFKMTSVPFVEIEESNISNARVNMIYTGDASESFFAEGWAGLKVDVICGLNLNCESWTANWIAPGYPFVGDRHEFEMVCTNGTLNPSSKCYSIKKIQSDGRNSGDSKGALMTIQAIIIMIGCIVLGIVLLLLIIFMVQRWRKRKALNLFMNDSRSLSSEFFLAQFDQNQS